MKLKEILKVLLADAQISGFRDGKIVILNYDYEEKSLDLESDKEKAKEFLNDEVCFIADSEFYPPIKIQLKDITKKRQYIVI